MKLARGFCDLNISATDTDLKKTLLKALSLGYQTLAINREVTDTLEQHQKGKKRKKGESLVLNKSFCYFQCKYFFVLLFLAPLIFTPFKVWFHNENKKAG
ncbi:hypothetical protein E2C01_075952 [Portunus trituberculatus]|uniref:Uncharacterized protein n=1 Tax=Portunus trituberculatus TaxID=210409 RepID=A0A5B7IC01_PORTR|nr:hypothetical protein [Portunus trituberculatus]